MTSIFLMATTKIFLCFFFNRKVIFVFKQTFFEKKFCMQNLIFCVHNVVLDILKLDFFSFSLHNFFQKRLKLLVLLYDMFLNALINVW